MAIRHFFSSFSFIRENGLRYYYFYPLILGTVLFLAAIYGSFYYVDLLSYRVFNALGWELGSLDKNLGFWENTKRGGLIFSEFIVFLILKISIIYLFFRANKYIVLILLSPVMAFLSEKAEEIVSGNSYPFVLAQFLKDIWRGILVAIRNFILEMSITLLLLILGLFMPFVSPIVSIILFFIGAYFYGFSTFDYINERKKRGIKESVMYLRANRGAVLGNGTMFSLFMILPVIGTVYGPLNATVAAILTEKSMDSNTK